MSKLKNSYEILLRCPICGCEDRFEYNDDKSYIKCSFCNEEYFGGIDELKDLNPELSDDVKEEIEKDVESYIRDQLKKILKGSKRLKIK